MVPVARFPGALTLHDIGADGRVLLAHEDLRRELFALAPGEARERDLSWRGYSFASDVSADARMVLFQEGGESGRNLYLRATDGTPAVRLGEGRWGVLSPDGKWVLAQEAESTGSLRLLPTGAGDPRPIQLPGLDADGSLSWSRDGRSIYIEAKATGRPYRVFALDLTDGTPRPVTPEGVVPWISAFGSRWVFSPDGLVLARDAKGQAGLHSLEGGEPRRLPAQIKAEFPLCWSADGRWIYTGTRGAPGQLGRVDLATGREEPWKQLMPADPHGVMSVEPKYLDPTGRWYVYGVVRMLSTLYLVDGLR